MNILGVGPVEIIVVLVLALLVLGPEGMIRAGRTMGKLLGQMYSSEYWQAIRGSGNFWDKLTEDLGIKTDIQKMQSELSTSDLPRLEDLDDIKSRTPAIQSRPDSLEPASQPNGQYGKDEKGTEQESTPIESNESDKGEIS